MSLLLRPMRTSDIDQVAAIDRQCFRPPWPRHSWREELAMPVHSHMVVLSDGCLPGAAGWRRHLRLPGRRQTVERIVGYGGMWLVAGEAHISTLAIHPDHRHRGYGELLLAALIRRALERNAVQVVLEVRQSNRIARNLYRKYGFSLHGIKSGYYREGNEDGCDMRLDLANPGARDQVLLRSRAIRASLPHEDRFNRATLPQGR